MADEHLLRVGLARWELNSEPYEAGVEDGIVWLTAQGTHGLCGYALIPAEGHPWSNGWPEGINDQPVDQSNWRDFSRRTMALVTSGRSFADAMTEIYDQDPYVPHGYLDDYVLCHGGVSWYTHPWIGFDAAHTGDVWPPEFDPSRATQNESEYTPHLKMWTPELMAEQARDLARQIAEIGRTGHPSSLPAPGDVPYR